MKERSPGPWLSDGGRLYHWSERYGCNLDLVGDGEMTKAADAALCAAAPEMLDLLRGVVSEAGVPGELIHALLKRFE